MVVSVGSSDPEHHRTHRRHILLLLLLMILINVAVRYPIYGTAPHVPDTYFTLDLGRELADAGSARWIISDLSYFGFFPLSYPSGVPFMFAEYQLLSESNWNSIPWVFSTVLAVLLVLSSFILFRAFRMSDGLSVFLAGLMGLSPFFLYFSYAQGSARGFVLPVFVLTLFLVFWKGRSLSIRVALFSLLVFGLFAMHRSSFVLLVTDILAILIVSIGLARPSKAKVLKIGIYAAIIGLGVVLMLWPFIPALRDLLNTIPEFHSSYLAAEWEFRSGFLFEGRSPLSMLANLATNYVGSVGLVIVLFPVALVVLYPNSRESRERDYFLICTFLFFAPFVWKAQYLQIILLPVLYLLAGVAIQRRARIVGILRMLTGGRIHLGVSFKPSRIPGRSAVFLSVLIVCMMFSTGMFIHRSNMSNPYTGEKDWPSESAANLGMYMGAFDGSNQAVFVSNSGFLDRHLRWYSGWDSPVVDSCSLLAHGYLNVTEDDFKYTIAGDFIGFLSSFYRQQDFYEVNRSMPDYNLYLLSGGDIYGFFRLYYLNSSSAMIGPTVSATEARIMLVVEIDRFGDSITNPYLHEGLIKSSFLKEVSSDSYVVYRNNDYSAFLAAMPTYDGG